MADSTNINESIAQDFDREDLDLIAHALSLFPNLAFAVSVTKLASKELSFPLNSHLDCRPFFEARNDSFEYRGRVIDFNKLLRFMPEAVFPIRDPKDLIGKLMLAQCWADRCHYHERQVLEGRKVQDTPSMVFGPWPV